MLVVLIGLSYGVSVNAGMLWDDPVMITDNVVHRVPDGLARIWRGQDVVDYFPLTYSAFWLQYRAFGVSPAGYHAVNVLLHAVAVLLVYGVLRCLRVPVAELAALLFALHPVVGTSVEWVSEQKNTLSLIFYALSTLAFMRIVDDPPRGRAFAWWLVSLAAFTLALLAKPSGVGLPIFFGLLGLSRGRRVGEMAITITPYLLLCLLFGIATIWFQRYLSIMTLELPHDPWSLRLAVVGWNLWFYARTLALPLRQSMVYPFVTPDVTSVLGWVPDLLLVALVAALWRARTRTGPLPLLALAYTLLMLAPVLGFVPIAFMRYSRVADHLAYLAAVGILALYASVLQALAVRFLPPASRVVGMVALIGVLVWLDHGRCVVLASRESCWRDVVDKYNGDVWVGYANLGSELIRKGAYAEAVPILEQHERLQPHDAGAPYNRGVALMNLGRVDAAIAAFQRAVQLEPGNVMAHNNLGLMWLRVNAFDEARRELSFATRIDPSNPDFQNNLGRVLSDLGRDDEAEKHLKAAVALRPGHAKALETLALVYARTGRKEEAVDQAIALTKARPDDAQGWVLLGSLLLDGGNTDGSRDALRRALGARTDQAYVLNDVGLLAARLGDDAVALTVYRKAQATDPKFLVAVNNEAWLLATSPDASVRNAAAAREAMTRCWTMGQPDDPQLVDTDAAVCAEEGDLARARVRAEEALSLARERGLDALADDIEKRLAAYRLGRPWRE